MPVWPPESWRASVSDAYSDAMFILTGYIIVLGIIVALAAVIVVVWEHLTAMWAAYRLGRMERRRERR